MNPLIGPQDVATVTLTHPSYGVSPAGFPRIHVELLPREVGRLIGYDPRTLIQRPKRARAAKGTGDLTVPAARASRSAPIPHNVSPAVVALQNQVQRSIDPKRVASMVEYLRASRENGTFADWGPIEVVTAAIPDTALLQAEHKVLMDADADYFIADGQHRYCAVLDFVREHPALAEGWTQALTISILPSERLVEWAGQAFHDRNYYAVAVRAGKALATDTRDPLNALVKELAGHPVIQAAGGIAYERDTLLKGDPRFTTHSVLHRFVKGFLYGRPGLDRAADARQELPADAEGRVSEYLDTLGDLLPWSVVDREQYLTRASVVLSALAVVGHDLYPVSGDPDALRARARALRDMDWRRTNLDWEGIVGSVKEGSTQPDGTVIPPMVQPASSRPAIDATIRHLRGVLGLLKSAPVVP